MPTLHLSFIDLNPVAHYEIKLHSRVEKYANKAERSLKLFPGCVGVLFQFLFQNVRRA